LGTFSLSGIMNQRESPRMTHVFRVVITAVASLALLMGAVVGLTAVGASAATDMDCTDFSTQASAQSFFLAAGGPYSDPHFLDSDGDGVACESNPCPCSYGTTPTTPATTPTPTPTPTQTPTPMPTPTPTPTPPAEVIHVVRVINGQLIKVREGANSPDVVHLLGVTVPKRSCEARAAKRDLRSWVKPGMVVISHIDEKAPDRDAQGNLYRALERQKGGWDIGGSQIDTGFANVDRSVRFSFKNTYLRWERKAIARSKGYHGTC
jgi:endonuclease YncB( thermonuclease family)